MQEIEACLQQKKKDSNQLSILYQIMSLVMNYMKIMNAQNDQQVCEIQTSFNHMTECQQKQFSQLQLLTSDSLLFQLKTAHSAADRLELASAAESSKYTSACVSFASSLSHVASSLLSSPSELELEYEMPSLSLKYHMCHTVRTVKTL